MSFSKTFRQLNRKKLLIVCYHGVVEDSRRTSDWLQLPIAEFKRQIEFLGEEFEILPIDEGVRRLQADGLERPTACITFDDGYRNNGTVAYPVLKQLGLPSTIYLTTGLINTDRRLWTTDLLYRIIESAGRLVDLRPVMANGRIVIGDEEAARRLALTTISLLKNMEWKSRINALEQIIEHLPARATSGDDFSLMNWAEVEGLARDGLMSFGAHTVNHEIVSRLPDAMLTTEIGDSVREVRERLESVAPQAISSTFAYPNGRRNDVDVRAERLLVECGVRNAVTTEPGHNSRSENPMRLRRLVVGASMPFDRFVSSASGLPRPLAAIKERLLP